MGGIYRMMTTEPSGGQQATLATPSFRPAGHSVSVMKQ